MFKEHPCIQFRKYCENGDLKNAKNYIKNRKISCIGIGYEFSIACATGQIDIAKWILTLEKIAGPVNIHYDHDTAFRMACCCNYKKIAEWLLSLEETHGHINIHDHQDHAFRWACYYEHLHIAKWLLSLEETHGKVDIHADSDFVFRESLRNQHKYIAEWIISMDTETKKVNIHAMNDDAMRRACRSGRKNIKEWLITLCQDDYVLIIEKHKFISWTKVDIIEMFIKKQEWKSVLDHLNITEYIKNIDTERDSKISDRIDQCIICYDGKFDLAIITPCSHVYCPICFFDNFYKKKLSCSLCRSDFKIPLCTFLKC
jgi:hypothetical protein